MQPSGEESTEPRSPEEQETPPLPQVPDGVEIDAVTKAHNDELVQKWGTAGPLGGGWWYSSAGKLKPCPPRETRYKQGENGNPGGKARGDPSILNAVKRRLALRPNADGEGALAARFADMIVDILEGGGDPESLMEFMRLVDMSKMRSDNGRAKRIVLANIGLRKLPSRTIEGTAVIKEHAPRSPNGTRNGHG